MFDHERLGGLRHFARSPDSANVRTNRVGSVAVVFIVLFAVVFESICASSANYLRPDRVPFGRIQTVLLSFVFRNSLISFQIPMTTATPASSRPAIVAQWTVDDVSSWLTELGIEEEHRRSFVNNQITGESRTECE